MGCALASAQKSFMIPVIALNGLVRGACAQPGNRSLVLPMQFCRDLTRYEFNCLLSVPVVSCSQAR